MEEMTDDEIVEILDNINHKTSSVEQAAFEARRAGDPVWDSKVKEILELQTTSRLNEARITLEKFWRREEVEFVGQREEDEIPIIPLWQNPRVWLIAASVAAVFLVGILVWVNQDVKVHNEDISENKNDSTKTEKPVHEEQIATQATDAAEYYISQVPQLKDVPVVLNKEAAAIQTDEAIDATITRLRELGQKPKTEKPEKSGEIVYGSSEKPVVKKPAGVLTAQEDDYRKLLLGIGYVKEKKYSEAISALNQIKDKSLVQDVFWYKGLAYVQLGEAEKARTNFDQITDARFVEEAKEISEKLK